MKVFEADTQKWNLIRAIYLEEPYDGSISMWEHYRNFLKKNNAVTDDTQPDGDIVFNSEADAIMFFLKYNH